MESIMPKVIGKNDLIGLDPNGRDCEVCGVHMHEHDWALLNVDGFAIFCSNLIFEHKDLPEVATEEHYEDGTVDVFVYGQTTSVGRMMRTAVQSSEQYLDKNGLVKAEVFAKARIIYKGPKIQSVKIGDWSD